MELGVFTGRKAVRNTMIGLRSAVVGLGMTVSVGCAMASSPSTEGKANVDPFDAAKKRHTPDQYRVTQQEGTEPPFRNAYWDNHAEGIYVDVVFGEPLFSSTEKFESGTGWPSFYAPLEKANVVNRTDDSHGMQRVEVRSKRANSHLGHLFDDGPPPTGMRYCMNSASLRFVPADRLVAEGYGEYAPRFPNAKQVGAAPGVTFDEAATQAAQVNRVGLAPNLDVAVLSGGCFWGMQNLLRKLD